MKTRVIQNEPGEPPKDTPCTGGGPGSLIRRHPVLTFSILARALALVLPGVLSGARTLPPGGDAGRGGAR